MAFNITVSLSQSTFERLQRWAALQQQDVETVVAEYLENSISAVDELAIPPTESNPAVEREREAYHRLFPELRKKYPDQYVAIHDGRLIDHDTNEAALFARIDDRFPDDFVWLSRIDDSPEREIKLRSPRLIQDVS